MDDIAIFNFAIVCIVIIDASIPIGNGEPADCHVCCGYIDDCSGPASVNDGCLSILSL